MIQKNINSIPLCSQCIRHEVMEWLNDKTGKIKPSLTHEILSELKSIKLIQGECIVCKKPTVSEDSCNNILNILKNNNLSENIVDEFTKFFCFEE